MTEYKTLEARVRRAAKRVGWRVVTSFCRDHHINDCGMWQLTNDRNTVVGGVDYDASLEECAHWIEQEASRLAA